MIRKALLALVVATTVLVVAPTSASAATMSADEFAAACSGTNRITPLDAGTSLRVVGGSGAITGTCSVKVDPGGTVVFRDAFLTRANSCVFNSHCGIDVYGPGDDVTIKVIDSDIEAVQGVTLWASAEGNGGLVRIVRSEVASTGILLIASPDSHTGGKVVVKESFIEDNGSFFGAPTRFVTGVDGQTIIKDNFTVDAALSFEIRSESGSSKTVVKRNEINSPGAAVISSGGTCRLADNIGSATPLACS